MATLLFIYGTLKRGHCRAPLLIDQQFLRTARTEPVYRLVHCGSYPGLVHCERGAGPAIEGELWDVDHDCLARLDKVEGVDVQLYERVAVSLECQLPEVESYLYLGATASLADCGRCWTLELERSALDT